MSDKSEKDSRAPAAGSPEHTPGPWIKERRLDGDIEVGPPEANAPQHVIPLATVYGDDRDPQSWPVTANAKLIAAAPALADALEALVEQLDGDRNFVNPDGGAEILVTARAALRAAGRLP